MESLLEILKRYFGFDAFRPLQGEIVQKVIEGKDVLALMPTGGGKSLCFQAPALYLKGTAIVVSPLIALMKDQVEGLKSNGIMAAALNSSLPEDEKERIRRSCLQGEMKLLYISPEGLQAEMDGLLTGMTVSLVAIDEAHCISRWGHDFRPEYAQLSVLKERFPKSPLIALTATADKITRQDIVRQLKLDSPQLFVSSFDRPNLSLAVNRGFDQKDKIATLVRFINLHKKQSGIVYCTKRADTEKIAVALAQHGIRAAAYHAGLPPQTRDKVQDDFIYDRIEVVCATIAFGMGIDKSNVRFVAHYNMPGSIENYYQEIGRAGRDGLPGNTMLLYSLSDVIVMRRFAEGSGQMEINMEKLDRMQRFCETDVCRRRILLNYFSEEAEHDCGNCDVCRNPPKRFDGSILVQKALSAAIRTGERVGINMLIDILRASGRAELLQHGYQNLKTYGAGRDLPFKTWKEYIYQMLQLGYMEIDYVDSQTLKVTPLGRKVLYGQVEAMLTIFEDALKQEKQTAAKERKAKEKTKGAYSAPAVNANTIEEKLVDELKQLRRRIAQQENIAPYLVFSDATLHEMAVNKPLTMADFATIRGVGSLKLDKYGQTFTAVIRETLDD